MATNSILLRKLADAGYTVEIRMIIRRRQIRTPKHRAVARDKTGIMVAFASAATEERALAKLAEQLGA
jgi:hypothetical protein